MKNKLRLVQKTVCLTCNWVPTGNPKIPLACVWTGSNARASLFPLHPPRMKPRGCTCARSGTPIRA